MFLIPLEKQKLFILLKWYIYRWNYYIILKNGLKVSPNFMVTIIKNVFGTLSNTKIIYFIKMAILQMPIKYYLINWSKNSPLIL